MTFLVERLAELRRHLDHLRWIRPRVERPESLERDLSLHNDVLSRWSLAQAARSFEPAPAIATSLAAAARLQPKRRVVRTLSRASRTPGQWHPGVAY